MKIVFLDPNHRLSIDTFQLLRRLRIEETVVRSPIETNKLIIIANGTPDNEVAAILLHTLNGEHTVALAFPKYKRTAIAKYIHSYINQDYNNIIVILDQEQDKLQNIYNYFKEQMLLEIKNITVNNRTAEIKAQWYNKQATIKIIVNGIDNPRFTNTP